MATCARSICATPEGNPACTDTAFIKHRVEGHEKVIAEDLVDVAGRHSGDFLKLGLSRNPRNQWAYTGTFPALQRNPPPAGRPFKDAMSNQSNITPFLAIAGLLGIGAVIGAHVVRPLVQKRASVSQDSCPLPTASIADDVDRWANEGGCCASSNAST